MKRTKHPKHNPANLTAAQVGRGYRLLDEDEVGKRFDTGVYHNHIHAWTPDFDGIHGWDNSCGWTGASKGMTYRTKLSRSQLAALRKGARP